MASAVVEAVHNLILLKKTIAIYIFLTTATSCGVSNGAAIVWALTNNHILFFIGFDFRFLSDE